MCKVWQKITFIKNEPYYGPTKLAEGKGQQTWNKKISYLPYLWNKNYWHYIKFINANNLYLINMANKKNFCLSLLTFTLRQLCGTMIRFIFYKCDLLPNLTHLELQTAEFGQNLAKRAKFFVFNLMVFSSYHLLGKVHV